MSNSVVTNPLLGALGPLSAQFAGLIRQHRPLLDRLFGASIEHFHILAIAAHTATGQSHAFARKLCEIAPSVLLKEAMPNHSPALVAALRRMGSVMHPLEHYLQTDALLQTNVSKQLVRAAQIEPEGMTPALRERFEAIVGGDPLVTAAAHAVCSSDEALAFHTWVLVLRAYNLLDDEAVEERSLSQTARGGLATWVGNRLTRGKVPSIGFRDSAELFMVHDLKSLKALGHSMRNCLRAQAYYHVQALSGSSAFFSYVGAGGPVAISLVRIAPGVYAIEEMAATGNDCVPDAVEARIRDLLAKGGIVITPTTIREASSDLGLTYGNRW